jgi:spore maturation protein CgeB
MRGAQFDGHVHRVASAELGALYRGHAAALNMRNEQHVLGGLNQRNFDPFLCGAAVATDPQPDLERCFEPGREVLVWHEPAEIDATSERLRREPGWAAAVAEGGGDGCWRTTPTPPGWRASPRSRGWRSATRASARHRRADARR